ncbi:MAG: nucleotide pyrophosphatase/phosphodiesterase family protein [Nanoarchaeota archaeon]
MVNKKSINAVNHSKFGNKFIRPLLESYCFSRIPDTIKTAFGIESKNSLPADIFGKIRKAKYQQITLFVLDGLGWNFFEDRLKNPNFLKNLVSKKAVVSKITAQFPSTTAAQLTTLHTGLPLDESGIYEWFYYEKKIDALMAPLLFSFAGDKDRNTLKKAGINPNLIFPKKTIYRELNHHGVNSKIYISRDIFPSAYLESVSRGAEIFPYRSTTEALLHLAESLINNKKPTYYHFYFDKIDSISHQYGPDSDYCHKEIESFFDSFKKNFLSLVRKTKSKNTLIIITSDHGQTEANPEETIYLNKIFPSLDKFFVKTNKNIPIVPAGSCRDMFLHIKSHYLDDVYRKLVAKIKNKAEVHYVQDLIDKNLFGLNKKPKELLERIGNLVILPYAGESVWWNRDKKFTIKHKGHHGGLSPEEMFVPFICLEI